MGAEEFAQILMADICRLHGVPMFLVCDQDKPLTSKFFARVSGLLQRMSTASHPRTDGQTDCANGTLEGMLRDCVNPAQTDWDVKLGCCECECGCVHLCLQQMLLWGGWRDAVSCAHDPLLYAQRMSRDADKARRAEHLRLMGCAAVSQLSAALSFGS